tara:strand:+ start:3606 stop:4001 length:396 start_codon:yes stop_codon:yes gene_type:complete
MSKWLFFPSPASSTELIANIGGWYTSSITYARSVSAGAFGVGVIALYLEPDPTSEWSQLKFTSYATSAAWRVAHQGKKIRITQSNGNTYEWAGTLADWGLYVKLVPTVGWVGTLPWGYYGSTDPSTMEFYT